MRLLHWRLRKDRYEYETNGSGTAGPYWQQSYGPKHYSHLRV
jgi:hypothetical protein